MAKLISPFGFIGSLGDVTAYRMRGVDGIILRRKGGPQREQITNGPRFANTRRYCAEFGGRAKVAGWLAGALRPISSVTYHNFTGMLNKMLRHVQKQDTANVLGERSILLSRHPSVLDGFPLNEARHLEEILTCNPVVSVARPDLAVTVVVPALHPSLNLFVPSEYAWFRVEVSLGIVPDALRKETRYEPSDLAYLNAKSKGAVSDWFPAREKVNPFELQARLDFIPPNDHFAVVTGLAVRFARVTNAGIICSGKGEGAGKIAQVVGALQP